MACRLLARYVKTDGTTSYVYFFARDMLSWNFIHRRLFNLAVTFPCSTEVYKAQIPGIGYDDVLQQPRPVIALFCVSRPVSPASLVHGD